MQYIQTLCSYNQTPKNMSFVVMIELKALDTTIVEFHT